MKRRKKELPFHKAAKDRGPEEKIGPRKMKLSMS
jgi:hypothetical protein